MDSTLFGILLIVYIIRGKFCVLKSIPVLCCYNAESRKQAKQPFLYQELIPHIGLIPMVIPLKLFLDMVPSSSTDVTRALRGYFRGVFVYVLFTLLLFILS